MVTVTVTGHSVRHRTGPRAAFCSAAFRSWLYTPVFDLVVSLVAYLLLPQHLSRLSLMFLLGVSTLAWTTSATRLSALRRPVPGFPNGLPLRMRHRLARLVAANIAILVLAGALLLLPPLSTAVVTLAALSLLRAVIVGLRIFSYRPAK